MDPRDYVHTSKCERIFSNPENRKTAMETLRRIGVKKISHDATPHETCEALASAMATVQLDDDACQKHGYVTVNGTCMKVSDATQYYNENRHRFSASAERRLKLAIVRSVSTEELPCYMMSGNAGSCSRNEDCAFHQRKGIYGMLFSTSRNHGECYVKPDVVTEARDGAYNKARTRRILRDVYFDLMAKEHARYQTDDIEDQNEINAMLRDALMKKESALKRLSKDDMVGILNDLYAKPSTSSVDLIRGLRAVNRMLGTATRYSHVTVKNISKLVSAAGFRMTESTAEWIQQLVLIALFAVENSVSWTTWLMMTPWGRRSVKRMVGDPKYAAVFFVSIFLGGDTGDAVLSYIPSFSKLVTPAAFQGGKISFMIDKISPLLIGWKEATTEDIRKIKKALRSV